MGKEKRTNEYALEGLFGRILSPFEAFLRHTTAGGVVLMATAVLALAVANSPWGEAFRHMWEQPVRLAVGTRQFEMSLHQVVSDGLMSLFFLVVGLELKREMKVGELSSWRDAALPVFALSNVGIDFGEIRFLEGLTQPVTLGVCLGLVLGKFAGIGSFSWIAVRSGIGRLPGGVRWRHLLGVAWLGGIGFTMSLFISQLAFNDRLMQEQAKLGILAASALSAALGLAWLYFANPGEANGRR